MLGHEGAGVVEAVGQGVTRVARAITSRCPGRRRAAPATECLRDLPQLCSTAWPAMGTGGLMDGTPRLSRDGEPVYHYSFLSTFAEACVVPERSCVPIPKDVPFDVAGARRVRGDDGRRRRLAHRRRAAGRPRRGGRVRRRRAAAVLGAVAVVPSR